ncbi:MAG: 1-aminocyclopropane-1-carboxylate deaminase/D-cysteine desulfhydrase [Opitutaceae bacterium]|nr:1-aminocyclopropane-1-carboxylate deaminase/D-cysteine desulfhydrase [Cytophagales bacterium]
MDSLLFFSSNSPVQEVIIPEVSDAGIQLYIKRDDLLHPGISGNKWRKLKYNIIDLKSSGKDGIITLGGAFSNHLHAVAVAGDHFGFHTIGIVRGEKPATLSTTLQSCEELGMKLYYITRSEYKKKLKSKEISDLINFHPNLVYIPEGGENEFAKRGCEEILTDLDFKPDYVCVACGTGTTLAGMLNTENLKSKIIGFPVLKGADKSLIENIESGLKVEQLKSAYQLISDYHFGGYAKFTDELLNFIINFEKSSQIPVEQVYTGKMMYGIIDLAKKGFFKKGSKILAIHTGGMQGRLPAL